MTQSQTARSQGTNKQLRKTKLTKTGFDFGFLITVITLLALGLLMVFSASYPSAYYYYNDGLYFIKRQLLWAALGTAAMIFTAGFDYRRYKKLAFPILVASFLLLVLVLLVGMEVKGAKRWIGVGGFSFQPSEVAKLALIIYFSASLAQIGEKIKEFKFLVRYWVVMGLFMGLLLLQPQIRASWF